MSPIRAILPKVALLSAVAAIAMPACTARAAAASLSDFALLNQVTWGATESADARLRAMGRDHWLDWQLHPAGDDRLPPEAQAQVDAQPVSQLPMTALLAGIAAHRRAADQLVDPAEKQAAQQAIQQETDRAGAPDRNPPDPARPLCADATA